MGQEKVPGRIDQESYKWSPDVKEDVEENDVYTLQSKNDTGKLLNSVPVFVP